SQLILIITLNTSKQTSDQYQLRQEDILLRRSILDRQIVDCDGLKVVRANDVVLGKVQSDLAVLSIDVGFRAILRRLGIDRFPLLNRLQDKLIPWDAMTLIESAMPQLKLHSEKSKLQHLHPADIANLVEDLNAKRAAAFLSALHPHMAAEVIEEIRDEKQLAIIQHLDGDKAGEILKDMSPDQAADIIVDLPEEAAQKVISYLGTENGERIMELLSYEEREAGGLMTNQFFAVRPEASVKDVKHLLIRDKEKIPTITYIYVTDKERKLVGVLSLRTLSISHDRQRMADLMVTNIFSVPPTAGIKEIAATLTKYDLLSISVTDQDQKLLGVVMIDDVMRELFPEA
ncbi:MAG TPA: CBS domain-containing protein, partial [bacterium]|nr:CBS domain-containing protein [bacterium]